MFQAAQRYIKIPFQYCKRLEFIKSAIIEKDITNSDIILEHIDMDYAIAIKVKYEEGLIKKREINALIKDLPEHIQELALDKIREVDGKI
tara:strand:+ start:124 stop:393 length:270 start_codon:yes stop_codon:yes gene_type:complete